MVTTTIDTITTTTMDMRIMVMATITTMTMVTSTIITITTTGTTTTATSMSIELSTAQAVMLSHWLSSAYPTGAFAYSHGIEAAMTDGLVTTPEALEGWIEDILSFGSGRNDAIMFCEAWRRLEPLALIPSTNPAAPPPPACGGEGEGGGRSDRAQTNRLNADWNAAVREIASAASIPPTLTLPNARGRRGDEATHSSKETSLIELIDLARALTASRPRFLESCQQGSAFLAITLQAWPHADLMDWSQGIEEDLPFPIAFAMAAKAHGLPLVPALTAYLSGFASSLVAAALRLAILGQTKAQIITARLSVLAAQRAAEAQDLTLDDLGSSAFHVDIAALRQETVPSRLFRS
jgi:urease accessory protein UreF